MKKFDLHIHTVSAFYEDELIFDISILKKYVEENQIDCIAITNHNLFDKTQFNHIKDHLSIDVLPGIEIDIEKGHILVIDNNSNVDDFSTKCQAISTMIVDENDSISISDFHKVFSNYSELLIIPHYKKDKSLSLSKINEINPNISCGEVSSANKWVVTRNAGVLTPLLFSDSRMNSEFKGSFKQTFLDVDSININSMKVAVSDKSRVWLNSDRVIEAFVIDEAGISVSTRLNVLMGRRSSGKTHFLNMINDQAGNSVKYIRQFELTESSKVEEFQKKIQGEFADSTNLYLSEFRTLVNKMLTIDIDLDLDDISKYVNTLKEKANTKYKKDIYSKVAIYDHNTFDLFEIDEHKKIIVSLDYILQSKFYNEVLFKELSKKDLQKAIISTIKQYRVNRKNNYIINKTNEFITSTKGKLRVLSRIPQLPEINFKSILYNKVMVNKFNAVVPKYKKDQIVFEKPLSKFKLITYSKSFDNVTEARKFSGVTEGCREIFENHYDEPYNYMIKLSESLTSNDLIYKMFFGVYHEVINEYNVKLSGGQRSEYSLIKKLDDCRKYDFVLIDEPEGSFDNLFLRDEIINLIHEISNDSTVFIATHNNTIGVSLIPNYIVFTDVKKEGNMKFNIYSGKFGEKMLKDKYGNDVLEYDVLINSMESGEELYNERKDKYETIKNT
ncbi:MAG: hypothetical protein UMR38_01880 [Candidatus Izemoplasma sp.]|nr:hypothetical protein [Candidatus Izemoplasma sp.]